MEQAGKHLQVQRPGAQSYSFETVNSSENARKHINKYFEAVDKLADLEVKINKNLLVFMVLDI